MLVPVTVSDADVYVLVQSFPGPPSIVSSTSKWPCAFKHSLQSHLAIAHVTVDPAGKAFLIFTPEAD